MTPDNLLVPISKEFIGDIRRIIEEGRFQANVEAGKAALATYWNIGRRIVEEEQKGNRRAEYGSQLITGLADSLKERYGTGAGYGKRNLAYYRQFYLAFNDLGILHEFVQNLTWTHIRRLLSVTDPEARQWYLMEYIKNPTVAEFMGFRRATPFNENELEQALIDNLEQFILELGRGFAFVERQQHITTASDDFFIDLVFYNFRMKRFVIFELKTHKMRHSDVGQLDMYVRMYDDLFKGADDNPTIGVLLCTDTDSTIAKYSVLNESKQLFAAKYMTYMPTEEELRREIERQKQFFLDHHKSD